MDLWNRTTKSDLKSEHNATHILNFSQGTHIRNIMRNSGANVRVDGGGEKKEKDTTISSGGKEEGSGETAPAAPSKDSAATPPEQDTSSAEQTKDSKTMNVTDSEKKVYLFIYLFMMISLIWGTGN